MFVLIMIIIRTGRSVQFTVQLYGRECASAVEFDGWRNQGEIRLM